MKVDLFAFSGKRNPPQEWRIKMRHYRRGLVALTAAVVAILAAAPPAGAATGKDPAVAAALTRIAAGTSTSADVALIKSRPEIAAQVMDPSATTVTVKDNHGQVVKTGDLGTLEIFPAWYRVEITSYTYLGFVHWKWIHHVDVYLDGVVVRQWTARYDALTYSDGTVYVGALLSDAASAVPTTPAYSFKQRRLDICVFRYGCYATTAPYSQININGDGSWWYNWGVV
jgi:hypothetical protein